MSKKVILIILIVLGIVFYKMGWFPESILITFEGWLDWIKSAGYKVAIFLFFFLFLSLYQKSIQLSNIKQTNDLLRNKWILSNEISLILVILGFFTIVYILSGFFNLELFILGILCSQLCLTISLLLRGIVGSVESPWGPRSLWAFSEFGLNHRLIISGSFLIILAINLYYFYRFGLAFFSLPNRSTDLIVPAFQYTLITMIFSQYIITIPSLISTLSSKFLDRITRNYIIIDQVSRIILTGLFLALGLWAFGISGEGLPLAIEAVDISFSPLTIGILFIFFSFGLLIPYVIGCKRSKECRIAFLNKKIKLLKDIIDSLSFPNSMGLSEKIASLHQRINLEILQELKNDKFLSRYDIHSKTISLQDIDYPNSVRFGQSAWHNNFDEAFNLSKDIDPRIIHVDWLDETYSQLNDLTDTDSLDKALNFYNTKLTNFKIELGETAKESNFGFIGAVIAAITAIIPSILSILASNLVKWVNELGLLR